MQYDIARINNNATQELNGKYKKIAGNNTIVKAIKAFAVIGYIGVFLSIAGSALGFYHDFYKIPLLRGFYISLTLALVFAVASDWARHHLLQLTVNFWEKGRIILSTIMFGIAFILTVFLITMHFKGMQNMEQNVNMETLKNVVLHEREIELKKLEQSKELIGTVSDMTSSAYNNGDIKDDILVAQTANNYGHLVSTLTSSPTTSYATKAMIKQNEESAATTRKSMTYLLPIIEVFTFASFLSMFILITMADKGAKDTANMQDAMKETRDNIYALAQEMMLNKTQSDLAQVFALLQEEQDKAKTIKEKEAWNDILASLHTRYSPTPTDIEEAQETEVLGSNKPVTTPNKEHKKTSDYDKVNDYDGTTVEDDEIIDVVEKKPAYVDPSLFHSDKALLISEMWKHGTVRVGGLVASKAEIRESLSDLSDKELNGLIYMIPKLNIELEELGFLKPIKGSQGEALVELSSVSKV